MSCNDYPVALPPLAGGLNIFNNDLFSGANRASRESPRKRIIQPIHSGPSDLLQRMLNSLQPGTYIRPHRHAPDRAESIVVLNGSILFVTFNESGAVQDRICVGSGYGRPGIDIAGGIWHCFLALEPDTMLFEVKPGPYDPECDKEFASWSPDEYTDESETFLGELKDFGRQ